MGDGNGGMHHVFFLDAVELAYFCLRLSQDSVRR